MAEFTRVLKAGDLEKGKMKAVTLGDETVCIINHDGDFYAINNVCTHEGAPLDEGSVDGYELECPWHGARFDIRTGQVLSPPAERPVLTYDVRLEGDDILLRRKDRS